MFTGSRKMNRSFRAASLIKQVDPDRKSSGASIQKLRTIFPDIWDLIRPRRWLLALGFLLMVINRISGLVLPYSTKFLIDTVIVRHQAERLKPLVLAVLLATVIQGITSLSLTQLLSKAAQRLITELRQKVQAHIGRLPVSFHDSTKTGILVSRIMSDVEGHSQSDRDGIGRSRWRITYRGHRIGRFVSHQYPDDGTRVHVPARFCARLAQGFWNHPSHLPRTRKDKRRGHRPPG